MRTFFQLPKSLKKKLINLGITLLIIALSVIWEYYGLIQIEIGKDIPKNTQIVSYETTQNLRQQITWELLISPQKDLVFERQSYFEDSPYFFGRIYDITNKETKKFLNDRTPTFNGTSKKVNIILEDKKYQQYGNDFKKTTQEISGNNIQFQNDKKLWVNYTHTKTFFDDTTFVIQTANLTHSSFEKNIEHFFVGHNTWILQSLETMFAADRSWKTIDVDDIHPNLLVCPINCRSGIMHMLRQAKTSIRMYQQYVSDTWIRQSIVSNTDRDIRILLPDTTTNKDTQDYLWPYIVHLLKKPYIHSKTILIDDTYLLIWSMNMSQNSLDNNREIWIIVTDPLVIGKRKRDFLARRDSQNIQK